MEGTHQELVVFAAACGQEVVQVAAGFEFAADPAQGVHAATEDFGVDQHAGFGAEVVQRGDGETLAAIQSPDATPCGFGLLVGGDQPGLAVEGQAAGVQAQVGQTAGDSVKIVGFAE
ncbi:hypothetical protein ACH518_20790 [Methylomonas sp. HW2-6]|uniref:hypothetical protein n=1 Tax=Methylomonas sp. HW2-6 TaxID=3376687 RepID=UPI004042B92A